MSFRTVGCPFGRVMVIFVPIFISGRSVGPKFRRVSSLYSRNLGETNRTDFPEENLTVILVETGVKMSHASINAPKAGLMNSRVFILESWLQTINSLRCLVEYSGQALLHFNAKQKWRRHCIDAYDPIVALLCTLHYDYEDTGVQLTNQQGSA